MNDNNLENIIASKEVNEMIEIEDKKYLIISELDYNDIKYIYGADAEDDDTFVLLKQYKENEEEYIESVTDEEEFMNIINLIAQKELQN